MTDPALLDQLRIDRTTPKRRPRRWPMALGLLVVLLSGWFVVVGGRALEVETAPVRSAAADGPVSVLDSSGYVTARRIATVSSKIAGKVAEVLIEEGMLVGAGDLLARLDAVDANAQLALARAQLAAADAQLGEARSQLQLAEATLVRQRELAARQLTSTAALEQAQSDRDSRAARLAALQRQVGVTREQLAVAQLGVSNTEIRAPFSGVIIEKAAQPGEVISPISAGGGFTRTGIGTLVDMESLEVQVDVNEANIGIVQPGQPVNAVLNAYPDWTIPGSVIAIIPTADRAKATVRVRIALDSRDSRILPDMGVRVSFLAAEDAHVDADAPDASTLGGFWVPTRAIVGDGAQATVFTIDDGRARRIGVRAFDTRDAERRVQGNLREEQPVILSPPRELTDGRRVRARGG
jgi:RND family efflux transporter MFP subunit